MRWLVLFGLIAGCGDNIAAIPYEQYAGARRQAECERLVRCGLFADLAACDAYSYPLPDLNLDAAIADQRVRYDGVAAQQCIDAISALTCDGGSPEARSFPEWCQRIFTGTAEAGDACAFDSECESRHCEQEACDPSMCCPGTCVGDGPSIENGPCRADPDCVAGTACGLDHVCHALAKAGDTCYRDAQCDYGLGCITQTNPGICRPLAAPGDACPFSRCALIGDRCDATAGCTPYGIAGAACSTDSECTPTGICDTSVGQCAALPDVGMPCTFRCAADAWCDPMSHVCMARLEMNAPCGTDNQCVTGYCAEGVAFDFCNVRPVCD
jgi:hypothetical protein